MQYLVEIVLMVAVLDRADRLLLGAGAPRARSTGWLETLYLANPLTIVILAFQRTFWVAGDGAPGPPHIGLSLRRPHRDRRWSCSGSCQRLFARLQNNFAQEL